MTEVLVVEDNLLSMELMLEILNTKKFCCDEAWSGEEAIKKIEKQVYDLILMDIEMPGMDGVEAIKIIKSKPDYKNVPVIAVTAYAMKGDRERFIKAGFDDFVSKPIDVLDFMKRIEKYQNRTINAGR